MESGVFCRGLSSYLSSSLSSSCRVSCRVVEARAQVTATYSCNLHPCLHHGISKNTTIERNTVHAPRKQAETRRYPPAPSMPARVYYRLDFSGSSPLLPARAHHAPRQISKYTKSGMENGPMLGSQTSLRTHTPNNPNRQRHAIESSRQERTGVIVLFLPDDACIRLLRPATVLATTRPRASRPLQTRIPLLPY